MAKLTAKQQRFVEEYLIDLNATQAAIRAGYSVKRASEIGYQLLQKTTVSEAVARAMAERSKRTGVSQDRVIEQLAKIAFADLKDYVNWNEFGVSIINSEDVDGSVLSEVSETVNNTILPNGTEIEKKTKKVKLNDKIKALELLGKHLGMWTEKQQVEFTVPVFVDDVPEED
ncbi:terminase small subunit [Fictibacillus gelatini]|uniref:terminase small subunit n=1 Tax=Fictibacillus gelatini TaxID=225985 RepID=UPI00047A2357|nr:terminase small subunit [Fictibacillus gelatini]